MTSVDIDNLRSNLKSKDCFVFIVGHTGAIGKILVEDLVNAAVFKKIVLVGRRKINIGSEDKYSCIEQRIVNFDDLESSAFAGCQVGYCCLGTTRGKAGKVGFIKVDHDYVVNSARLAKEQGCQQFHLVSSQGANANASILYTRIKGEVENELKEVGFQQLVIYRPGFLVVEREEQRIGERFFRCCCFCLFCCCPASISIPGGTLTKAMFGKTLLLSSNSAAPHSNWECLENIQIHDLASQL